MTRVYPAGMVLVRIGGGLPGGEAWSTGFQWDLSSSSDITDVDRLVGATAALLDVTSPLGVGSQMTTSTTILKILGYFYDGSGPSVYSTEADISRAGTGSSQLLPNQCATVATLHTGSPGRSRRGRMYWPLLAASLTSGQLSSAVVNALGQGVLDLFSDIQGFAGGPPGQAVVGSQTTGAMHNVTAVSVDSIVDTQRRRRDKSIALQTFSNTV